MNQFFNFSFVCLRYVYVPEDQNSSKSIEIERVMREARLRELIKGVYSSSYGDSVASKVCLKENNTFLDKYDEIYN